MKCSARHHFSCSAPHRPKFTRCVPSCREIMQSSTGANFICLLCDNMQCKTEY